MNELNHSRYNNGMRTFLAVAFAICIIGCNNAQPEKSPNIETPVSEEPAEVALDTPEKTAIADAIRNHPEIKEMKPKITGLDIDHGWALARIESTTTKTDPAKVLLRIVGTKWTVLTFGTDLSDYKDTNKVRDDLKRKWGL